MGYYQASERLDDTSLVPVGERVAGKVKAGFKDAIAFVVRRVSLLLPSIFLTSWITSNSDRRGAVGNRQRCVNGTFLTNSIIPLSSDK